MESGARHSESEPDGLMEAGAAVQGNAVSTAGLPPPGSHLKAQMWWVVLETSHLEESEAAEGGQSQ